MQPRPIFPPLPLSPKFPSSDPLYKIPTSLYSTSDREKTMEIKSHRDQSSFRHFSEQLRVETAGFSSLSIGETIWSVNSSDDRRNILSAAAPEFLPATKLAFTNPSLNRIKNNGEGGNFSSKGFGFSRGNGLMKNYQLDRKPASGKKNSNFAGKKKNGNGNNGVGNSRDNFGNGNGNGNGAVDKRFKTLPAAESLPRSEAIGGYIFVCNNDTMQENLERQLFGLPSRYRDSVRAITPGLPLFLYNYTTHQLYGIFEAASFGGTNIDPLAWEDKKKSGESRFPAQVRVATRKLCEPLEEDSFRPFLHHYDGPKFRLELSIPEALALLDIFEEKYM